MKIFLITLISLLVVAAITAIGWLCVTITDPFFTYIIMTGSAIVFGAVIFNNSRLISAFQRYRTSKNPQPVEVK